MNWTRLLLILALSASLSGCLSNPPKYQWGKAGNSPTEVWQHYDWVIRAME